MEFSQFLDQIGVAVRSLSLAQILDALGIQRIWNIGLAPADATLRLLVALLCGAVIGVDREWRKRPAGLRTHMLVALASAIFTIIAFEIYHMVEQSESGPASADPLRLLEAITAGVAFLAAGTIIRGAGGVKGVTTGAGLWLSGALGMACGQAQYGLAAVALVLAFVVLTVIRVMERWMHGTDAGEQSRPPEKEPPPERMPDTRDGG
jgi:putative Mg2+ transporter-C (MgtC) family protein